MQNIMMKFLLKFLNATFLSKRLGGVVRHLLTLAGGYLVSKGIADQSAVDAAISANMDLIGGGIVALVGFVLSYLKK